MGTLLGSDQECSPGLSVGSCLLICYIVGVVLSVRYCCFQAVLLVRVCLQDVLVTVFENGKLLKDYAFSEVRANAEIHLVRKSSKEARA